MQKLLYSVGGLFLVLIVTGLALPRYTSVAVSTTVDAYPATVFALVNDFRRVALWSPLLDTDPNARVVFAGPPRGTGASMTWDGTIIGSGAQRIIASRPFEYVETAINPGEPGAALSWFEIGDGGGVTAVSWRFESDHGYNLVGRYVALLMKGVIERDYGRGLASLKDLAESLPRVDFSDIEIEAISVEATQIAYLSTASRPEPAAISEAMGDAYFEVLNFIDRHRLQEAGAPLSITRSFAGSRLLFDAAIPVRGVSDATPRDGAGVRIGMTYAGPVIRVKHVGPYRTLGRTHQKIAAYLAALGIERDGDAWESYVSDPTRVPEDEILTFVYYPIRR